MHNKKILFLGTHGQHNIGDELLLETFLEQLGTHHTYFINSYDPEFTANQLSERYDVHVFHTTNEKWRLPSLIWQSDLLFFGGGSVIKELYKSVGRNRYATLLMILLIVTFAKWIARKPIIMSNIGVGPLSTRFGHFMAKLILHQVTLLSVRDQNSYDTCHRLSVNSSNLHLVPDAVFVNDASCFRPMARETVTKSNKLKIALNLNYDIENRDNWDAFLDNVATSLHTINQQHSIEIHALPMQSRFKSHDDLSILTAFKDSIDDDIEMILHEPHNPEEIGGIISECDLVVAERLHTLVIAAILQKPFVALMYDVKVTQLAVYLGMCDFSIDINQPFGRDVLANYILDLMERREETAVSLKKQTTLAKQNLDTYFATIKQNIEEVR